METRLAACTQPVVQLLLAKRVVDVRDISCKEQDDPQSDKYRAILLKTHTHTHTLSSQHHCNKELLVYSYTAKSFTRKET